MKEPRIVTAQKIKRALQIWKKAVDEMSIVTTMHVNMGRRSQQVSSRDILRLAQIFNLDIQKTRVDHDSWHGTVWLEGMELYAYKFDFKSINPPSYKYQETKKLFKQAFFEADGDKLKAFEIARAQSSKEKYTDYFKNYKTIAEIEKFWHRQESRFDESTLRVKYIEYKRKWEELEWDEREGNRHSPYTFTQWVRNVLRAKVAAMAA